jgi:hypothetical protein
MATAAVRTVRFSRADLATLIKDPRLLRAFEMLAVDVAETIPDAIAETPDSADTVLAADIFRSRAQPQPPIPGGDSNVGQMLAAATFTRPPQPATTAGVNIDAGTILAAQIFGA